MQNMTKVDFCNISQKALYLSGFDDLTDLGLISTREIAARMGYSHTASLRRFCKAHDCPLPTPVRQGWYRTRDIRNWFEAIGDDTAKPMESSGNAGSNETNIVSLAAARARSAKPG